MPFHDGMKIVLSALMLAILSGAASATPLTLHLQGLTTYEYSGGSGHVIDYTVSLDTAGLSQYASGGDGSYTYRQYSGLATWIGSIGTETFSLTRSSFVSIQNGISPGYSDAISLWSYLTPQYYVSADGVSSNPNAINSDGVNMLFSFASLPTLYANQITSNSNGNTIVQNYGDGLTATSVVPEPRLSDLFN